MKSLSANLSMTGFGARLSVGVALCALLLIYANTLWPQASVGAQTKEEPVTTQAVSSTVNEKEVPARKEGADVKGATDADAAETGVNAPQPEAITTTSYVFSNTSGVALDDMSSGTTQLVAANLDDTASSVTNIGFDFWYDGVRFTQFSVNANGLCRLGGTAVSTSFDNSTAFASTTNAPKIAPYYDDLWTGTNGKVHFKVTGSAPNRKLVVEWLNEQIPRVAAGNTGAGTFQMWLFETTGVIEFVYGNGIAVNSTNGGYSIGLQSGVATNFASVTTATNTVSYTTANNTQTNAITAGTAYTFTPQTAADPSGLNFTGTTATTTTLNWTDNSSNEVGFVVYRSTDNVNFTFIAQTPANTLSFSDSGLTPNTQYFYQVRAVTEGALSAATSGNVTTAPAGNISSTAAGGPWSSTATWVGGVVPTAGDNVTISDGATVTIDTGAVAFSVTVGTGGTPAVLQWDSTTTRTLNVGTNVTIAANGIFQSAATGTVTTHLLSLGGNLTNNGVLDFSTNANTAGAAITFTGAANNTFGGTGATTDVRAITINKGTSNANVLELNTSNFTVRGVTTDVAGFLTLTNGTFKISGTFTVTNRVFTTAIYTIPATGGIWLNNPNFVVAGTVSSTTTVNNGLFRVSQGTYNIGTGAGDEMGGGTGAVFIVEGGTVNASGRIDPQSAVSYTQTGGTVNVATVGNNRSIFGSFEIFSTSSTFTMSGGTINVINRNTGTTQVDYDVLATTTNVTGGLLVIGATGAPASTSYQVQGTTPNLTINATMTMVVTQSASSGFPLFMRGTTVTNNGTISQTSTSARFDFAGTAPMTYTGGTFGTAATPFGGVGISANSTSQVTLNSPIFCNRVNLFQGGFINSNQITLGTGGTSTTVVQIGSTGLTTPGGNFDVSPVHNQGTGTGGEILLYAFETAPRTTGVEINPTRDLLSINVIDNPNNVTIAGGDLSLHATAAALVLTNGRLITGANTLTLSSGTATVTRTNGYVDGNFKKVYSAAANKSFEVGTANGFSPVSVNVGAGTFPTDFTVKAVQGQLPQISGTNALQRYWALSTPAGNGLSATLTFNYLATDVVGTAANYVFFKNNGGTLTQVAPASPPTNTQAFTNPVSSFSDWTLAESSAVQPGTFQFSSATYSDSETNSDHTFNAVVNRVGGTDGNVSVDYQVTDGTATAGSDYTIASPTGTLTWNAGDATPRNITITVKGDTQFEPDETVNFAISNPQGGAGLGTPNTAVLTITNDDAPVSAGQLIISEFRLRGPVNPSPAQNEFIEIYNNTDSPHTVGATDASAGYGVAASDGVLRCTIPNGTTIPAHGHFLCVNSLGYSLGSYPAGNGTTATGDATYTTDIPDNAGIALFSSTTTFTLANRLDAVGSTVEANTTYKEGTGYPALVTPAPDIEYSFYRNLNNSTGTPKDTDDNATDFLFVDTNATSTAAGQRLGAPGPENLSSPVQRNSTIKAGLIDPGCSGSGSVDVNGVPNGLQPNACARQRDTTTDPGNNSTFGTLSIRRKFTNNTGAMVTRLRFRIVDLTTFPALTGTADLRPRTSATYTANLVGGGTTQVLGLTLEEPPDQPHGGGLNSTVSADTITLAAPLGAGNSINVHFLLGVQQTGTYRFFINVEALPSPGAGGPFIHKGGTKLTTPTPDK